MKPAGWNQNPPRNAFKRPGLSPAFSFPDAKEPQMDSDWSPEKYARFADHRLRPALDLLRALPPLPDGDTIDLGCGNGAVGPALATLGRPVTGVDTSPAMLDKARDTGTYTALDLADIATWVPDVPPALVFSNAALHWLPDHHSLLPRLAALLAPGGTLAVQVPAMNDAPSHKLWLDLAEKIGGQVPAHGPGILTPAAYHTLLAPLGKLHLWRTEYFQTLEAGTHGHPVRRFTESTYGKPVLDALAPPDRASLTAAYDTAIDAHYPRGEHGSVQFPFRRLFFTLTV